MGKKAFQEQPMLDFKPDEIDNIDFRANHRERTKSRFMTGGSDAMPDYELLELILFRAIKRKDVKPMAHRLMHAFGGFNEVVSASPSQLKKINGVGEATIRELKIVEAAAQRLAQKKIMKKEVIGSWDNLIAYCRTVMSFRKTEQFRILFLDKKNCLIADEIQQRGTVDHVPVYPREVAKRALELEASALILVHNHPSGDPSPSQADIDMTQRISFALDALEIRLHDHIVIGKNDEASFHSLRLL